MIDSKTRWRFFILVLTLHIWALFAVSAQAKENQVEVNTVRIVMKDGVRLSATVHRPSVKQTFPTILIRTPYGKHQHQYEAKYWTQHGYAVVVQDTRGKFDSEGDYLPFIHELEDGWATLDWILAQDWSNQQVGMWGSSYLAFCQLVLASARHPGLKSIMPISGWLSSDNQITHGGAHHLMLAIPWILHEESQTKRPIGNLDIDEMFAYLPLIDVFRSIGLQSRIWNEGFDLKQLDRFSADRIQIPALHITGWLDFVHTASLRVFSETDAHSQSLQKLIVGPWFHDQFYTTYSQAGDADFGPDSVMGKKRLVRLALRWFDLTLKGIQNNLAQSPKVKLFIMGANQWKSFERWPPANTRLQKWNLGSVSKANSTRGDGFLTQKENRTGRPFDTFLFDPMRPVPTHGGANMHFMPHLLGIKDQSQIEQREDVLVYTSTPLTKNIEIIGRPKVVLFAATEGFDTDFTAKLVQVRPNGYAANIEEGILRASYRQGNKRQLLKPGQVVRLEIQLGPTAMQLSAGDCLRLEISSSNFPKYDRNPNTGEDPLKATQLKAVNQTIYYRANQASYLLLPVLTPSKQKGN